MNFQWFDFIGNIGVFLILITYLLLQLEKLESQTIAYCLLNAIGASAILFSLCFKFNLSAFLIEFFWLLISVFGLIKVLFKNSHWREKKNKPGANLN